ncbi:TetR/AcrR family transcriptional regulator [Thermocatellispora tengchongensis]
MLDTAIELIGERGMAGFSLAEVSRRLGVTVAAPYRHFADRDEVLAGLALRAVDELSGVLRAQAADSLPPRHRLAAAARAFVRFAAEHRSLYQVLVASGLDKSRHAELRDAGGRIGAAFLDPALVVCGGDAQAAQRLVTAVVATAQGYAGMLLDGSFGQDGQAVEAAALQAAHAVLALVLGRDALTGPAAG